MENQQQSYDVDFVHGKKSQNGQVEYFVKWVGYKKRDSTWEPPSAFVGISQQLLIRFERCLDYKLYHTKIYQRESKINIRIHIMNKGCQVYRKQIVEKVSQQKEFETNATGFRSSQMLQIQSKPEEQQEDYDFCLRRGRGRPRKNEREGSFLNSKSELGMDQQRLLKYQQQPQLLYPSNYNKVWYVKSEKEYLNEMLSSAKIKEKKKEKDESIFVKQYLLPGYKNQETDQPIFNLINQKYYDASLKCQVSDDKIPIELIQSHHLMHQKQLIFKCNDEKGVILYFDYDTLKQFYPTLLLDYFATTSLWKN